MTDLPPGFLTALLAGDLPELPIRWSRKYFGNLVERANRRIDTLDARIAGVSSGRTMPAPENVAIGSGRQFSLAVMFLDISGFTGWPSGSFEDQRRVLLVMDVFMAEMMNIVRDHGGQFEKNTGDGIMAYFGTEGSSHEEAVRDAVECAVLMHYVNDKYVTPWMRGAGLPPVRFRVGIDYGAVTIAKIGIHGTNTFVAIGASANVANRLLRSTPDGIAVGNEVYTALPRGWAKHCGSLPSDTGYVYAATQRPYPVWELRHRMSGSPTA